MNLIEVTIDGKKISCKKGTLFIEAIRKSGGDVPALCYCRQLPHTGNCRLCMVRIKQTGQLVLSCSTETEADLDITTSDDEIIALRKEILVLIASTHSFDCHHCPQALSCRLHTYLQTYLPLLPLKHFPRTPELRSLSSEISHVPHRCIACGLCISYMTVIEKNPLFALEKRGISKVSHTKESGIGNVIDICPTGALVATHDNPADYLWQTKKFFARRRCRHCSGEALLWINGYTIVNVSAHETNWICDECRFTKRNIHDWQVCDE